MFCCFQLVGKTEYTELPLRQMIEIILTNAQLLYVPNISSNIYIHVHIFSLSRDTRARARMCVYVCV